MNNKIYTGNIYSVLAMFGQKINTFNFASTCSSYSYDINELNEIKRQKLLKERREKIEKLNNICNTGQKISSYDK